MCLDAAEGIKFKYGKEYGFYKSNARATTHLDKLAPNELCGFLTNSVDIERDLSKFSHLSEVAEVSN